MLTTEEHSVEITEDETGIIALTDPDPCTQRAKAHYMQILLMKQLVKLTELLTLISTPQWLESRLSRVATEMSALQFL